VLDSSAAIQLATRQLIYTDPHHLGDLTLSVLQGTSGPHAREIQRLVERLAELRPEVVLLSNSMLSALAGPIHRRLNIPVVSSFLGEDSFMMDLDEPYRSQCIALLREHAKSLAAVVCPSSSSIQQAGLLLQCSANDLVLVRAPIDLDVYSPRSRETEIPTVGFLSVIRPAKGADILVRAVALVAERLARPMRLLIAGQVINSEHAHELRSLVRQLPQTVDCRLLGEVSLEEKIEMWQQVDVGCFPSRVAETRGTAALEAMACGVPIIAPAHGCFPELTASGGGWLFDPGSVDILARQITSVLTSADRGAAAGKSAAEHARKMHDPLQVARGLESVLQRGVAGRTERIAAI
jgi:glycosyltransferase involved in cell wall biosynthesis